MKEYLDGKIKLKDHPTLEDMLSVADLLHEYPVSAVTGIKLLDLLSIVCEGDIELLKKSDPEVGSQILEDFWQSWKPLKFISRNTSIRQHGSKSSPSSQKAMETSSKS